MKKKYITKKYITKKSGPNGDTFHLTIRLPEGGVPTVVNAVRQWMETNNRVIRLIINERGELGGSMNPMCENAPDHMGFLGDLGSLSTHLVSSLQIPLPCLTTETDTPLMKGAATVTLGLREGYLPEAPVHTIGELEQIVRQQYRIGEGNLAIEPVTLVYGHVLLGEPTIQVIDEPGALLHFSQTQVEVARSVATGLASTFNQARFHLEYGYKIEVNDAEPAA